MKYRVEVDVAFDNVADAEKLLEELRKLRKKAYKPKGTEKISCFRTARMHHCTHDEVNPTPCGGYANIDFDAN